MKNSFFVCAFVACTCILHASGSIFNSVVMAVDGQVMHDTIDPGIPMPRAYNIADAATISPLQNVMLNYTQIMFEHPQLTGAEEYILEVAEYESGYGFEHSILRQKDSSTATLISNFDFGKKYSWRYAGIQNGKQLGWQGPYTFEILNNGIDKTHYRVRVLKNDSLANASGLIMLDMSACIDRNGNFVWFLPPNADKGKPAEKFSVAPVMIQDLRLTPLGTVTLINGLGLPGARPEERDLNGLTLWKAPAHSAYHNNSTNQAREYNYHHCFKRLASGNYMVLDKDITTKRVMKTTGAKIPSYEAITDTQQIVIAYETLRELDRQGKTIWSWNSENYFDSADLSVSAMLDPDPVLRNKIPGGHLNAFDVDEKNGFVYAGFRNANRVIKIDKKTGKVVSACGDNMFYHGAPSGNGFFSKQHGTAVLKDGSIAVFNNGSPDGNIKNGDIASSVKIFTFPGKTSNSRLIWQFNCTFDSVNYRSNTGGNVDELKNGNLLVCMGDVNRIFEVNLNRQILWDVLVETRNDNDPGWHNFPVYRAHYTSSLYPCYFTTQTSCDTLKNGQTSFLLKIFNDGTEDDSYQVNISSTEGNYNKQFSTGALHSKSALSFSASANSIPRGQTIKATVKSNTNPDFIRTVYVHQTR